MNERLKYTLTQANLGASIAAYGAGVLFTTLGITTNEPIATGIGVFIPVAFWVMNFLMFNDYKNEGW